MKTYTGKEWKEKWKNDPALKGLRMREEPADWEIVNEHGTPVDAFSGDIIGCVGLFMLLIFIAIIFRAAGVM